MVLPTFLGIGAFKSATTTLAELLAAHPDVFVDPAKESDFFSLDERWERGVGWYEARFAEASDARVVGEISPSYAVHPTYPDVVARAASVVPDARLVYLVRDPIERIRSMYRHLASRGMEDLPFTRAVLTRLEYLEVSRYGAQVARWMTRYPRSALLVVATEDLALDPAGVCARIFAHIGVDPSFVPPEVDRRVHQTAESPDLAGRSVPDTAVPPALRRWFERQLARDQARFRDLVGDGAPMWGFDVPGAVSG